MKQINSSQAMKKFKPERVVFVISYDKSKSRPSGMVCGWSTICSSEPDMLAVALWKEGYTHKLIRETREFVVAVPNKSLLKAIKVFGEKHGDKIDKFRVSKVKTLRSKYIKPPLLADATMNFECVLDKEVDSGDHILFLGKVVASYVDEGKKVLVNMGRKDGKRLFKEFSI